MREKSNVEERRFSAASDPAHLCGLQPLWSPLSQKAKAPVISRGSEPQPIVFGPLLRQRNGLTREQVRALSSRRSGDVCGPGDFGIGVTEQIDCVPADRRRRSVVGG